MECMNCKGSGCMHCRPNTIARIGYDAPDLIARGEGPDTLSPEEIRAAKADWYDEQARRHEARVHSVLGNFHLII